MTTPPSRTPGTIEPLLAGDPFGLDATARRALHRSVLGELTRHHWERCAAYRRAVTALGYQPGADCAVEELPFIPVRLFKEFELRSVEPDEVFKTLTSSGTTGQAVSRIYLDRDAAAIQSKVLVRIVSSFTGAKRLPFLVVDTPSVMKDRALFSARGAGIVGFSMLGRGTTFLLDDRYQLDEARVAEFQANYEGESAFLFGFTFMVWEYLVEALRRAGRTLRLRGVLAHGGGWKKLAARSVDNATFRRAVTETVGVEKVLNYYGMVEQTGSIFMECPEGVLHSSVFSDVIVRDPLSFRPLGRDEVGLLQLVSLLPVSYPGHSILSEDLGEIVGVDDCPCGRKGTRFRVHGRIQHAETRGCSGTHAPAA